MQYYNDQLLQIYLDMYMFWENLTDAHSFMNSLSSIGQEYKVDRCMQIRLFSLVFKSFTSANWCYDI